MKRLRKNLRLIPIALLFCMATGIAAETPNGISVILPNEVVIQAEYAQTLTERAVGLMYRDGMKENRGMLFRFDDDEEHMITMKNMRFDLDVVFLSCRPGPARVSVTRFPPSPATASESSSPL